MAELRKNFADAFFVWFVSEKNALQYPRLSRGVFWVLFAMQSFAIPATLIVAHEFLYLAWVQVVVGVACAIFAVTLIRFIVQRLHDTDRSGKYAWWIFVPVLGWIVLIPYLCENGTDGTNDYGITCDEIIALERAKKA